MGGHEGDTIGAGKGGLPAAGRDHIYIYNYIYIYVGCIWLLWLLYIWLCYIDICSMTAIFGKSVLVF